MWDEEFERILRDRLPFLPPDEALEADLDLTANGLDSMGIVDLMVTLERQYDVRFGGDMLSLETFSTPAVLWKTVTALTEPAA